VALAAFAGAAGFLTKGPVGLVIPGLVVLPIVLLERRSLNLRLPDAGVALLIFVVVALPWYGAMWARHGSVYLESFFVGDNFERFATDRFNDPRAWWFYGPVLLGGLLPWTPLALVWIGPVWRFCTRRQDLETVELRLLLWGVLPLAFYSMSVGKQPRYILPVLPPLAILLARSILERTRDWRSLDGARIRLRRARPIVGGALGAGLLLLAFGLGLWRVQPLLVNVAPVQATLVALVVGLAGLAVIAVGFSPVWRQLPGVLAVAAAITFAVVQYAVVPASGDDTVEQVARAVTAARQHHEAVGTYQVFVRNLVFYARVPTTDLITDEQAKFFLLRSERVLVVAPADVVERLEQAAGRSFRRLAEFPYFNQAGIRLRTLIEPDPGRDLTRVLLIANQ
jgi:4-amino-4-deoxy-L-arabinose transferase-like glycosyltransferase